MEKKSIFLQEIATECVIEAPAAKVYSILSDFSNFNKWTNDLVITGDTQPGGKMSLIAYAPGFGRQKFSSRMVRLDVDVIAFDNIVLFPFLFIGRHHYEIIPLSEKRTKIINAEVFSGLAIPVLRKMNFIHSVRKLKEDTNAALKKAVEAL